MHRDLRFRLPALAFALVAAFAMGRAWSGPSTSQLVAARADAASKAYGAHEALHKTGRATSEMVYAWSVRWFEAQGGAKGGAAPADRHLRRMQALEATVKGQGASGLASGADVAGAAYYRAEAELWAAEARGKGP